MPKKYYADFIGNNIWVCSCSGGVLFGSFT
jgi:hypothetical protein